MLGGYGHVRLEGVYEIVYTLEYIYIYMYISMMMLTVYLNIKVIWPYMSSLVPNAQMEQYIFFLPSNTKYMQDI